MKNLAKLLLAIPVLLFSCQDLIEELNTIGTFKSTITGAVEKQFDATAAFVHTININATPQGSSLTVALSKASDQSELIALSFTDLSSTDGIPAGTYNYTSAGSSVVFLPVYTDGQDTYNVPDLTKTNRVVVSSVENTRVKGDFEVNLIDIISQKSIKIVGTFDALGTTETE